MYQAQNISQLVIALVSPVIGLRNILPITTAKVPIVKFEHRQSGLEGDISLYNTLVREAFIIYF